MCVKFIINNVTLAIIISRYNNYYCFISTAELIFSDPVFKKDDQYFLTNEESFDSDIRKATHLVEVTKHLDELETYHAYQ